MKGSSLQLRHYTSLSEVNKHYLFEYVQHQARVVIEIIANCSRRNYQVSFFSESSVNLGICKEQFAGNAAWWSNFENICSK